MRGFDVRRFIPKKKKKKTVSCETLGKEKKKCWITSFGYQSPVPSIVALIIQHWPHWASRQRECLTISTEMRPWEEKNSGQTYEKVFFIAPLLNIVHTHTHSETWHESKKRTATSCVRTRDSRLRAPNRNPRVFLLTRSACRTEIPIVDRWNEKFSYIAEPTGSILLHTVILAVGPARSRFKCLYIGGSASPYWYKLHNRKKKERCASVESVGVLSPYKEFSTQYKPRFHRLPHGPSGIESRCMIFK